MSAAVALTPRVRIMVICDEVRKSKTEAGVFHLKGVRQEITVEAFPFVPSRLWLFLVLSSPRPRSFPAYVRVVNERTDRVVYHANLEPRPTFGSDGRLLPIRTPIRFAIPEAGTYSVQVCFFNNRLAMCSRESCPFLSQPKEAEP